MPAKTGRVSGGVDCLERPRMDSRRRPHGTATEGAMDLELGEAHEAEGLRARDAIPSSEHKSPSMATKVWGGRGASKVGAAREPHRQVVEWPEIVVVVEEKNTKIRQVRMPGGGRGWCFSSTSPQGSEIIRGGEMMSTATTTQWPASHIGAHSFHRCPSSRRLASFFRSS
ncbi:hypothetical protein TIFTF001_050051 [Ficus carica]|uniref:Uncharacterized protein n=1 Tax=Ficus carica TaxID=3494 RepID=A0AA88CWS1_FICCA|nr:hypothetical protein TIFTF001_050051 [Ficus carica]